MAFPSELVRLHLPFDSGLGDVSEFGATVTAFGGIGVSSSPARFGSALQIDAAGKYLDISGPGLVLPASTYTSVSFWINTSSSGADRCIMDWQPFPYGQNVGGFSLHLGATNGMYYRILGSTSGGGPFGPVMTPGVWYFVQFVSTTVGGVGTVTARYISASVDGTIGIDNALAHTSGFNSTVNFGPMRIGRLKDGGQQATNIALDDFVVRIGSTGTDLRGSRSSPMPLPANLPWQKSASKIAGFKTGATALPGSNFQTTSPVIVQDRFDGGRGYIVGTVKKKNDPVNIPLRRKVRLFREHDGRFIRETFSDATTGAYAFTGIDPTIRYTIVSYDYEQNFRAVIADNILPEVAA